MDILQGVPICLCGVYKAFIMWTKAVNVPGNGGIVSGRSDTVTFSRTIPWHLQVVEEVGDLLVHDVVFCLIPHRIQQASNVHPIYCVSRLAVLVATLEERRI